MIIYDALKKDHDKLKPLLARLVDSADADEKARAKIIETIRDELIPHSRAEEAVFYNSLRTIDGVKEMAGHGYVEHVEAEAMLRALQTMDAFDIEWKNTARKLKEALEHHIAEEENEIFPAAKQVLAQEEAMAMGEAFAQMKPEIKEGSFVETTMDLLVNVMPARFAGPFREILHKH